MKIRGCHLSYCTNIHAGESWADHFTALKKSFAYIKGQVSPAASMGIGLRLSNLASVDLIKEKNLTEFKRWLNETDAYVFTMNGFPYGGFHHTIVKDQVHAPDWTTIERVEYTIRLFTILSNLLPEGEEGSISTSPLSYRYWHKTTESLAMARQKATENIIQVAEALIHFNKDRGVLMHLDLEPEPDGLLETGEEFISWFENDLLPSGKKKLADHFSISESEAETLLKDHICLCYDVCHFAIGYEPHEEMIDRMLSKGIKIGKVQISAALKAILPDDPSKRAEIKRAFEPFNEPTYLHQVVARSGDSLIRYPDLPEALEDTQHPETSEWRAHFHVPIFIEHLDQLQTTQADIVQVLKKQQHHAFSKHLEAETYTWGVLPADLKLEIAPSIVRELNWVKDQLT
jgi:hypothetical protein